MSRQIEKGLSGRRLVWICTTALLILSAQELQAQPGLEAYDRGDLGAVRVYLAGNPQNPAETLFLRAALSADADSALEMYRQVVLKYPESPISQRALDRIRQYYYAQGRYDKAAEFEKALKGYTPPQPHLAAPSPAPAESLSQPLEAQQKAPAQVSAAAASYCLQVGAFSDPANAKKLKSRLEKAGFHVVIIPATQSPNRLHTVQVTGYKSEKEALAAAEQLTRKFKLNPIFIPNDQRQ